MDHFYYVVADSFGGFSIVAKKYRKTVYAHLADEPNPAETSVLYFEVYIPDAGSEQVARKTCSTLNETHHKEREAARQRRLEWDKENSKRDDLEIATESTE